MAQLALVAPEVLLVLVVPVALVLVVLLLLLVPPLALPVVRRVLATYLAPPTLAPQDLLVLVVLLVL